MEKMKRLGVFAVPLLILLAGAVPAFAQGGQGNGTLVGTVVDNVGVVPGATITATHVATNTTRTGTTNEQGEFRLVSLAARPLHGQGGDGRVPSGHHCGVHPARRRNPPARPLTMTAGGVTESVTITAEVTPVQTANSALSRNITGDTLVSVQVKGRDVFGMMKILPGVMDSHQSRDYAQWNSGRYLSINGGDSLNKNTTIDGVPVGEEGGIGTTHITPNIDSIGEVNVITSGYNAEHGRQSRGSCRSRPSRAPTSSAGRPGRTCAATSGTRTTSSASSRAAAKPFFEVNIGGYSIGGPVVIPKVIDSRTSQKKIYFFLSQEFTEDIRPTNVTRTNLPTELERKGDFSQTFFGKATLQAGRHGHGRARTCNVIRDPLTGAQFPGNVIPQDRFTRWAGRCYLLAPQPNNVRDRSTNAYHNSNYARRT